MKVIIEIVVVLILVGIFSAVYMSILTKGNKKKK